MLSMLVKQVLEHFKVTFPPKIDAQLSEIDNIATTIGKARVTVISFFKSELPKPKNLIYDSTYDRNNDATYTNKTSYPNQTLFMMHSAQLDSSRRVNKG